MTSMTETSELLHNTNNITNMGSVTTKNRATVDDTNEFKTYDILHYIYASMLFCLTTFFQQSIGPITDVLQKELNMTSSGIGLLSSSYFIAYCTMQLPFGVLLQTYSHHIILLLITIGITISWILFGFINSFIFALIIRIFSGLCGSPSWIILVTLAGDHFGNNNVAFLSGISSFISMVFILILITMQGYIYEKYVIWREIYYILGVIGCCIVISIILTMYCQYQRNNKIIINGSYLSWMQLSYKREQQQQQQQQQQHSLAKLKTVISNYLNWCLILWGFAAFTIYSSIFGLWLIPYLMIKFSYSRTLSSFFAGIGNISTGFGAICFGYLSAKCKKRKIFLMIEILLTSTFLFLIYLDKDLLNEYIVCCIIIMVGFGNTTVILWSLVREYNAKYNTQETSTGFVSGLNSSSGLIAGYIIGLLIEYHSSSSTNNHRYYTEHDYQFAFQCVIITCLIILVITTFLLKETNGKNLK